MKAKKLHRSLALKKNSRDKGKKQKNNNNNKKSAKVVAEGDNC